MSGSAGGNRIPRSAVEKTVKEYIDKVLSKVPGFKSAKVSGSYNTSEKQDFGDIDLIASFEGEDKKEFKKQLSKYLESLPDDVIVPFKSEKYAGKKTMNTGEIVTILYPITGMPGEFVQIDNIIALSEEEGDFKQNFLDYPAEIQGLILGLVKVVTLEEDPNKVIAKMGIKNIPTLEPNQEYEFNLSSAGLTLRIVTLAEDYKQLERTDVWKSSNWGDVKKLLATYDIDQSFKDLVSDLKKLKNPRSKNRIKGIFKSMVSIKSGEVNTPKGDNKQMALDTVAMLEKKYGGLVQRLISGLIYEEITKESIALYPGKFKPPHKGHFEVAKQLLDKVNKVEILISDKKVEGITAEQSKAIWELYNKLLGGRLDIKIIQGSPVKYVLDTIEANQNNHYVAVYGKGEEDRYRSVGKDPRYMNAETFDGGSVELEGENISATNLRKAIVDKNIQAIKSMLPDGINAKEYIQTLIGQKKLQEIVTDTEVICDNCGWHWPIADGGDDLYICHKCGYDNDPKSNKTWDLEGGIVSLSKYMLDNGLNIKPLPKVKFISNDEENASNMLGKTAYYNPSEKSITLYTFGRHPKDILRSFSHEMIHHCQNIENRLNNINTTNTNEDGNLPELEKEAYEKGNMMLRKWEDNIKANKYLNEYKQYALNELFEKDLPNIEKISSTEYKVGNGEDIEAIYYFKRASLDPNDWEIHWKFTDNNENESPEVWKQVTATSYKILKQFIDDKNPRYIEISGNTDKKTKIYKSKSYLEKLENIFNNQYKIDNSNQYVVYLKRIEEIAKSSIQKRMNTLNESYEQALDYWQNGDLNSKSKIERWNTIKRKIEREVLQEIYNIKNV
jgi:predicted nucleotidyltransferase